MNTPSPLSAPGSFGLLATTFVLGLTGAFIAPFGALWATNEIGMGPEMLGAFMTINALSAILLSTLIARWSDTHVARRTLLLVGALAGAVGTLGYASVRDPVKLTLIGSSALALASMNFAQLFAHAREEFARTARDAAQVTFALGVLRASYALSWMVGPNLGAAIKERHGYPGLFVAAAVFFVLLSICVYAWVAYRPRERAPVEASPSHATVPWRSTALVYCAGFGLMFAASTLNNLNLPLFLTEDLGGTERDVGIAFSISPLFELAFMIGFGHLAGRGQARSVMLSGIGAAVLYFLLLRFIREPWQAYPLQVLNAAGVAVTVSVAIPFIQDLLPGRAGVATNLYANALKVGSLIGFSSFGLLARHVGHGGLFLLCAGLGSLTFLIVALANPRHARS